VIGKHHRDAHDTELEGAVSIGSKIEIMWNKIMRLFERAGLKGFTDHELKKAYVREYGAGVRRSLGARRFELVEAGKLVKSDIKRPGPTGVANIVWRINK